MSKAILRKPILAIAGGLWLALIASTEAAGGQSVKWEASWIGAGAGGPSGPSSEVTPKIVLKSALYGVEGDRANQVDLTDLFKRRFAAGDFTVEASNKIAGRDPAFGSVKTLVLEVGFGKELMALDRADWCDPILVKK